MTNFSGLCNIPWGSTKGVVKILFVLLVLSICFFFSPFISEASDLSAEKALQQSLEQSRDIIDEAGEKLKSGNPITPEITRLKELFQQIRTSYRLLQEEFRVKEGEISAHGTVVLERHRVMSEGYSRALQEYLGLLERLSSGALFSSPLLTIFNLS